MSALPKGWASAKFAELNDFSSSTIDPAKFNHEIFELYSVPIFPAGLPEFTLGSEIGSSKQLVAKDDVLVCKINPRINRVWTVSKFSDYRQIASSEWIGFRSAVVNSKYAQFYFQSPGFRELLCADVTGVGGSLTRAQPKRVALFDMPVAPLPEQKRIADKLDATLARVDACHERLTRVAAILKRFRQSVLAAASSGQLTADWREQQGYSHVGNDDKELQGNTHVGRKSEAPSDGHANKSDDASGLSDLRVQPVPPSWLKVQVKDVCEVISGYAFKSDDFVDAGALVVKISNVQYGEFEIKNQEFLPSEFLAKHARFVVTEGDLLLALTRPVTNNQLKVCSYPSGFGDALLNQRVCKLVCKKNIGKDFFAYYMQSHDFLAQVQNGLSETLQPNLSPKDLEMFDMLLPPLTEQTEIVRRVDTLFAFADRLEARLANASAAAERLTPSLLAKAFRGELVPQDPNDEPASELLKRLAAQREAAGSKPKRGRKASS